jgi:putative transposase
MKQRKSIRLKEYDYSMPGGYFVTICTHERKCSLGEFIGEDMQRSRAGEIVQRCWEEIPSHFENVELDAFTIQPNHIHGIIIITEPNPIIVGAIHVYPLSFWAGIAPTNNHISTTYHDVAKNHRSI